MPVIIEEFQVDVQPSAQSVDAAGARPAEGGEADPLLDLLELAREREQRLAVD